jgi:hypothetical protein
MGAIEIHLALDILIHISEYLWESLVAGLESQYAPPDVCGGRRPHCQFVHYQTLDLKTRSSFFSP